MLNEKITYSIIIPHCNEPKLLNRLLSSIPMRLDIEVIVVDDCSDESYKCEMENISQKYSQYHFISTNERSGAGSARNIGLKHATGTFVIFADSDDYFLPYINDVLHRYGDCSNDIDIVFFKIISLDSSDGEFNDRYWHIERYYKDYYGNNDLGLRYLYGEPWGKIIRRQLINDNGIYFDQSPINNDTTFSYLIGFYAQRIIVDNTRAYCLTARSNSVSTTINWSRLNVRLNVFARKYNFLKKHNIRVFDYMLMSPFWYCIKQLNYTQFVKYLMELEKYNISRFTIYCRLPLYIIYLANNKIKELIWKIS